MTLNTSYYPTIPGNKISNQMGNAPFEKVITIIRTKKTKIKKENPVFTEEQAERGVRQGRLFLKKFISERSHNMVSQGEMALLRATFVVEQFFNYVKVCYNWLCCICLII